MPWPWARARRFRLVLRSSGLYIVADSAAVKETICGLAYGFWTICRDGDAGLLCAGRPQSGLHPGVRGGLWIGLDLRHFAGRMAVRRDRSDLGADRGSSLAETNV